LLAVIDVYKKLLAANKDLKIPEVEDIVAIEKRGELKDFIAKAHQRDDK